MEVNFELRVVPESTTVKAGRMFDAKVKEQRNTKGFSTEDTLRQLQEADRQHGDELTRQAELTAEVIKAQEQQRLEHDMMVKQLREAREGLKEVKSAVDAQAKEIATLAEQYQEAHERLGKATMPDIDPKELFEEVVKQATATITNYTNSVRAELQERDRIVAKQVWQTMEPARQLIVGVCGSVFP